MLTALTLCLLFQSSDEAIYILEEIQYDIPEAPTEVTQREIFIGKHHVRTDRLENGDDVSYVYVPRRSVFYVINRTRKNYFYVLTAKDKHFRQVFDGMATVKDGSFEIPENIIYPTNQKQAIGSWFCHEYQINYPKNFGVITTIWVTRSFTELDRSALKTLWHTSFGTSISIPYDVRQIVNTLLEELNGAPIRTVTTIDQEGVKVTTISTIKRIEKQTLNDPNFFGIPSGYDLLVDKGLPDGNE